MAGAFLLPALSPEDGIPVVQAGSCAAALHCDEFSTDVFLLSLLSTLPVLLFSPACLQPGCSSFLNTSITFLLLFSILLLNFSALLLSVFFLCVSAHCVSLCCICYYSYDQTTSVDVSWIISTGAVENGNWIARHFFHWVFIKRDHVSSCHLSIVSEWK